MPTRLSARGGVGHGMPIKRGRGTWFIIHASPTAISHLLPARLRKDRRAPAAGRTPATPPFPAGGPGEACPRRPSPAATADCRGASPSPSSPPPNADADSSSSSAPLLLLSDKPRPRRPEGSAAVDVAAAAVATAGAAATSPPARAGSVIPEGILTSARWDRSDRRWSKEGRNAAFHSSCPSRPPDADDGSFRFRFPKVASSRTDDWRLSASLL